MVVSIDIGTSYSSICMLGPEGKAQPVDISTGASMFGSKYSLPTAVFVEDNGRILVGQAAMNSRKRRPQNFRMEFKRNLGEDVPILLGERSFRPEELYTEVFMHMKACAEKVSGEPAEKIYLTCPASYGERRKEKLRAAAKAAGLFDVELVDEPTAAAMCYCAQGYLQDGQTLLAYDFGGGTFDVSLLRYQNGTFELLAEPEGLEQCGGIDMDRLIYQDMLASVEPEVLGELRGNELHYMRFTSQLAELAVKAKHHLTSARVFEEDIQIGFDMTPYRLTVEKFNGMVAPLVGQTIQMCRQAMEAAGVDAPELSAVLMVGGTSRVPLVQEMVRGVSRTAAVLRVPNLELAVAQGALNYRIMVPVKSASMPAIEETEALEYTADEYVKRGDEAFSHDAFEEAGEWYQKAVLLGCVKLELAETMSLLAYMYEEGMDVPEDAEQSNYWYQEAFTIYLKRARQGDVEAMDRLGGCYERGEGVPRDKEQSYHWYHKAFLIYVEKAQEGDEIARSRLGDYYERGNGVPQDEGQSYYWYRKALAIYLDNARKGNGHAMYMVGYYSEEERGTSKNRKRAIHWYRKAAKAGYGLAVGRLKKLGVTVD